MKLNKSNDKLLYLKEHRSCNNYQKKIETGFKYLEFRNDTKFEEAKTPKNDILFFLEGSFSVCCNQYLSKPFEANEMVLIPRSSQLKIEAAIGSSLLSMSFDTPEGSCDKLALQSLSGLCDRLQYEFKATPIKNPLPSYLEVLKHCVKSGMNCMHLHDLMQGEFFFLLRGFYSKREIAGMLHPIIGKEMDFKDFIMSNYLDVTNIEQLIALSNLGRSSFFLKFNEVFGMTAKQWMLKQRNKKILEKMAESDVFIKDVVDELGFDSPIYFSRYCKKQFGCTPRQLIERLKIENAAS